MKFVTYNVQYGIGLDENYDPKRIAAALEGADIIALQEVSRNLKRNGEADLPAIFVDLLPGYYHAFGPGTVADAGSAIVDGRAVMRQFEFGNMVMSRYPILAVRNILLPRSRTYDRLNIQRSALEALVATPSGPIRVYSVHLDHRDPDERIAQIGFLKARVTGYGLEGGAVTGGTELGFAELPHTDDYVIMGDFNMQPEQPEYIAMVGAKDLFYGRTPRATSPVDALDHLGKRQKQDYTWEQLDRPESRQYLDYCFVSATLAPRLKDGWVNEACIASDHKPVWVEME